MLDSGLRSDMPLDRRWIASANIITNDWMIYTFPVIWTCLNIGTLQILCQKIGFSTKLEKNILDDRMSIFQSEKHHADTYRSNLPIFTQVIDSLPFHSKNIDTPVVPSADPLPQTSVLFACRCYQQSRLWCFTKSAMSGGGFWWEEKVGGFVKPLPSFQIKSSKSITWAHEKPIKVQHDSALKACKGHDGSRERLAILSETGKVLRGWTVEPTSFG